MATDIHNLIAAIVPDVYCKQESRAEVKKIAKESGYLKAAEKAKVVDSDYIDLDKEIFTSNPFKLNGIKNPIEKHYIEYDNFTGQNLEPIYFWILDYINTELDGSIKLVDNFVSSPGSGHFGDMIIRIGQIQQTAQRNMELANTVIKSILNMIYDLKDWRLRLLDYERYRTGNPTQKSAALLSLKERWLDAVDVKRGQASIRGLTSQLDFVTLQNAFFASESIESAKKIDLNNIVRNVLLQRLSEFFNWINESEKQLRTRYELEKKYLTTQVNSLKLYSRWVKPYLKAIKQLEQRADSTSSLVTAFETTLLELTLLGKKKYNIEVDIAGNNIPKSYRNYNAKKFQNVIIVQFNFRASPQKTQYTGGYTFRGRTEITFSSYSLTEKEIEVLTKEVEKDDVGDLMKLIAGATDESLDLMQEDIDEFMEDEKDKKAEKKISEDVNPFTSLFSLFKSEKKEEKKGITKDLDQEKILRNQSIIWSRLECRKFYNTYKGTNNMPSFF